ncbi:MAG: TlpA family protein disulfide reductase [Gammaproteobacteria bacterium]|nr:TlpA family protein disulfide reductase [Gammaproteobacteria bacterium]MDH3511230.1 TlpA family protein disulfide reductase [Gammaproteobacteria bacterium]
MRAIGVGALALACLLAGLWISQKYRSAQPVEPPLAAVEYLPDFTLPDLDDQPRSIMEWSGRPLLINFWATWCAPCRREMPLLQTLQDERSDGGLQVIGVALDNLLDVKRFVAETKVTYPILYGEDDATRVAESFGEDFIVLPFSAFVAPGGEILALHSGELYADDLRQLAVEIEALVRGERSIADARESLLEDR